MQTTTRTAQRNATEGSAGQVGVHHVSKAFGATQAMVNVTLSVEPGEFVAIVGPSGCGKSTLLSAIAGLIEPDSGEVLLDGVPATNRLGRVALMPQRDALLPWRTVLDNAVLGAEIHGETRDAARQRARALLPRFGLEGFGEHYPSALSGGMRQRAAFLRTVLTDRDVLLLDEPFGALDALTRRSMQEWLLDLWDELGRTILMVTHDVEEALLLSDRVAVMTARPGTIKLVERVQLPRPRRAEMAAEPTLVRQKAELLAALKDEVSLTGEPGGRR
ncbi:MAG TPA: ABC transporter ATP-binding protein [Thermomicrobiales bacterium]|nr:ABC transporter ATP-binding protein [Thermomicrobiales bacterium]